MVAKQIERSSASTPPRAWWIGVAAWPAIVQYLTYVPEFDAHGNPVERPGAQQGHPFLGTFQKRPTETELNDLLRDSDKKPDLGWTYTVIAGVLNVLVIYDALSGAAFGAAARPAPPLAPAATPEKIAT